MTDITPTTYVVCTPAPAEFEAEHLRELFRGAIVTAYGDCPEREVIEACQLEWCTITGTASVELLEDPGDTIAWVAGDRDACEGACEPSIDHGRVMWYETPTGERRMHIEAGTDGAP